MNGNHKTVIGLNLKNHLKAVAASLLAAVALTLPYISVSGEKMNFFGAILKLLSGSEATAFIWLLLGAVCFTVVAAMLALVGMVKISKPLAYIWQATQALSLIFVGLMMFSTRMMLKAAGITDVFLNKDLGAGYWLTFIASFAALVLVMNVNPGLVKPHKTVVHIFMLSMTPF